MIEARPGMHRRAHVPVDLGWRRQPGVEADVSFGSASASGGKSHSCVTPTTSLPAPIPNRISVALGSRLTILVAVPTRLGRASSRARR